MLLKLFPQFMRRNSRSGTRFIKILSFSRDDALSDLIAGAVLPFKGISPLHGSYMHYCATDSRLVYEPILFFHLVGSHFLVSVIVIVAISPCNIRCSILPLKNVRVIPVYAGHQYSLNIGIL